MMRIACDREIERSAQVDAFEMRRRDAPQIRRLNGLSTHRLYLVDRSLHVDRVPRHHGIGEQRQRRGHRREGVMVPGQFQRNLANVDRPLNGMYRLSTIKHMLQFGAKRPIGEVVDQVNRPEQLLKFVNSANDGSR